MASYRRRNHPCQILILARLVKGLGGYGSPKSGVSQLTLNVALRTVLDTNVLRCDKSESTDAIASDLVIHFIAAARADSTTVEPVLVAGR